MEYVGSGLCQETGDKNRLKDEEENMKPFVMYLIGTSGSGKTTIARKLAEELEKRGMSNFQLIDGDEIRDEMDGLFGYTYEERMKNNTVVCLVVSYLIRNSINVILAQVAGYQKMRDQVRCKSGGEYIEIYVKCSVEECARRDVKGYYKRVKSGEMKNVNGLDTMFETPQNSDLIIDTEKVSVDEAVKLVLDLLERKQYLAT